jgi:hypothetical protein
LFYEETDKTRVIPGLKAAGADVRRIFKPRIAIDGQDGEFHLIRDKEKIIKALVDNDIRCLIVDPIMNLLGAGVDSNKSNEVRPTMRVIKEIAEAINGFVLVVAHLNKGNNRDVIESVTGSGAFAQYPRQVILFMEKDENNPTRVMEQRKNNSGKLTGPMEYQLDVVPVLLDSGLTTSMTVFNLLGPSKVSLQDIVEGNIDGEDGPSETLRATKWLREYLDMEQPASITQAKSDGKSQADISNRTMGRAARKLGVQNINNPVPGKPHQQCWVLPDWKGLKDVRSQGK